MTDTTLDLFNTGEEAPLEAEYTVTSETPVPAETPETSGEESATCVPETLPKRKRGRPRKEETPNSILDVPNYLMHYPPFATSRQIGQMEIIHFLDDGGRIIAKANEFITTEDAEKFFVALFVAKDEVIHDYKGRKTANITVSINDVRKICKANDYDHIIKALNRIASLKITRVFPSKTEIINVIHEISVDKNAGEIIIMLNNAFYESCRKEALSLNIALYTSLSPTAKNVYCFLNSNQRSDFTENRLIERSVIKVKNKFKARQMLKRALKELVSKKYLTHQRYDDKTRKFIVMRRH